MAGATIAAAIKVTPTLLIDAITTAARINEKNTSTKSVRTPYTLAVSLSNKVKSNLF
jgi:hypothetical protein